MPYSDFNLIDIPLAENVTEKFYDSEVSISRLRGENRKDYENIKRFIDIYGDSLRKKNVPYGIFKVGYYYDGDITTKIALIIGQAYKPAPNKKVMVLGIAHASDYDNSGVRFIHYDYSFESKYITTSDGEEIEFRVPTKELSYVVSGRSYNYTRGYEYTIEKSKSGETQLKNILLLLDDYYGQVESIAEKIDSKGLLDATKEYCEKLNPEAKEWEYELIIKGESPYKDKVVNKFVKGYVSNDDDDDTYMKAFTYCKVTANRCELYFGSAIKEIGKDDEGTIFLLALVNIQDYTESMILPEYILPIID